MALGVADVVKIVLSKIGGVPLAPVPTATIAGGVCTVQTSPTVLSQIQSLASQISSVATAISSTVSAITDPISQVATAVGEVTESYNKLSSIAENPVGYITNEVKNSVTKYSNNNYEELDSTLSGVKTIADSNAEVAAAYDSLKQSISQSSSKVSRFATHTDNLSQGAPTEARPLNASPESI